MQAPAEFPADQLRLTSEVTHRESGVPLSSYLSKRFTYHTSDEWQSLIKQGRVLVNDKVSSVDAIANNKDIVTYLPYPFDEPAADFAYSIIYEDEWLLGINKPGNLLVHRAGKAFRSNLLYQLRHGPNRQFPEANSVNRLDRETSGVVLVARDAKALSILGKDLGQRKIQKEYCAVVHGNIDKSITTIDLPLGPDTQSKYSYKQRIDRKDGKHARTEIAEIKPLGPLHSLITLVPHTGRTHQLRVHLASIGHPIVCDRLYGLTEEEYGGMLHTSPEDLKKRFGISRHALHCSSMAFEHPVTKCATSIQAPLPEDMKELIRFLSLGT